MSLLVIDSDRKVCIESFLFEINVTSSLIDSQFKTHDGGAGELAKGLRRPLGTPGQAVGRLAVAEQPVADPVHLLDLRVHRQSRRAVVDEEPRAVQHQDVPDLLQRVPSRSQHLHFRPGEKENKTEAFFKVTFGLFSLKARSLRMDIW